MIEDSPATAVTIRSVALPVPQPAVSWAAIWAGASVAVATSLLLTMAGAGLGYALGFPGLASRDSLAAFTPTLGAGAIVVQVLSAALGGYIAGRLRTTWIGVHGDESHFRDTAHGLIAWAVATVAGLLLAALVLAPYTDQLAIAAATAAPLTSGGGRAGGPHLGPVGAVRVDRHAAQRLRRLRRRTPGRTAARGHVREDAGLSRRAAPQALRQAAKKRSTPGRSCAAAVTP
ncbi:MAG: hypothetical protein WDM92_11775 [Caulobacteraceae bacterium]